METKNPTPIPKDSISLQSFSIEQNKALWLEIAESVKETRLLERYAVIGTAAYWAFLIRDGKLHLTWQNYLEWVLIPVLFAVLGGLRSLALLSRVTLIGGSCAGLNPLWSTRAGNVTLNLSQENIQSRFLQRARSFGLSFCCPRCSCHYFFSIPDFNVKVHY
jgi:hypothetical protein